MKEQHTTCTVGRQHTTSTLRLHNALQGYECSSGWWGGGGGVRQNVKPIIYFCLE